MSSCLCFLPRTRKCSIPASDRASSSSLVSAASCATPGASVMERRGCCWRCGVISAVFRFLCSSIIRFVSLVSLVSLFALAVHMHHMLPHVLHIFEICSEPVRCQTALTHVSLCRG